MKITKFIRNIITLKNDQSGQTIVEFLIVCPVILISIILIMRTAMIINAKFLVKYAAYSAARTGIVYNGDKDKMRAAAATTLAPLYGKTTTPFDLSKNRNSALKNTDIKISFGEKADLKTPSGSFDSQYDANVLASNLLNVEVIHKYPIPFLSSSEIALLDKKYFGENVSLSAQYTMRMQSNIN